MFLLPQCGPLFCIWVMEINTLVGVSLGLVEVFVIENGLSSTNNVRSPAALLAACVAGVCALLVYLCLILQLKIKI